MPRGDSYGKYAGQPHTFSCAKCRKHPRYWRDFARNIRSGVGMIDRIELTGKTRKQRSQGMNYHRWGDVAYQYRCLDCGHVGWSRHPDVARVALRHTNELDSVK